LSLRWHYKLDRLIQDKKITLKAWEKPVHWSLAYKPAAMAINKSLILNCLLPPLCHHPWFVDSPFKM